MCGTDFAIRTINGDTTLRRFQSIRAKHKHNKPKSFHLESSTEIARLAFNVTK